MLFSPTVVCSHKPSWYNSSQVVNPAYLAIFLLSFTLGWGKTPHR